ncbi:hypothetical protein DPMN_031475 [Dreissena polymorpha]|uniref:Uncharacterized protein n=1 Tax=Dreissena polymorpha TaxID=45954 RepID=A0A9D4M371_DREPO|nr:hypothetical protein DPMN_031475 [Dreissena polymorpha]
MPWSQLTMNVGNPILLTPKLQGEPSHTIGTFDDRTLRILGIHLPKTIQLDGFMRQN